MSLLEKIIYIADIIEEGRNFQGVNELRKKAYENIDKAILMSCNFTIEYVLQRGLLIHPLTIELRNTLILGGKNE
jgi:nicotinate-nucleotide adenylyltransferase